MQRRKERTKENKREHCDQSQACPILERWMQKQCICVDVVTHTDKYQRPNTSANCCRGQFAAQPLIHFQDTFIPPLAESTRIKDYPDKLKMQMIPTISGPPIGIPQSLWSSSQLLWFQEGLLIWPDYILHTCGGDVDPGYLWKQWSCRCAMLLLG